MNNLLPFALCVLMVNVNTGALAQEEPCHYEKLSLDGMQKSLAEDKYYVNLMCGQPGDLNETGCRNWTECMKTDLKLLATSQAQFDQCLSSQHPQVVMKAVEAPHNPNCSDAAQKQMAALKAQIEADKESIRRLNAGFLNNDIDDWTNASIKRRREILKQSLLDAGSNLLGKVSEDSILLVNQPLDILGYHLPNGISSIGVGQANEIIAALRARGVTSDTKLGAILISAVRKAGQIQDKRAAVQILSRIPSLFRDMNETEHSSETVDSVAASFQVIADLVGKGDFAVATGIALYKGSSNLTEAFIVTKAIGALEAGAESELKAVHQIGSKLQSDVQALDRVKARFGVCQD